MRTEVKYSSKRLLLTLMLCACSVILLQNYSLPTEFSFTMKLFCLLLGLTVCFICFLPAVLIKKRSGGDVLSLVSCRSPLEQRAVGVFYAFYFMFVSLYFLIPYCDMFCKKYYPDASPCLVALLLLACCVYAAFKGANAITRFGIFLFALAMLTNTLMFGGSVSSLQFNIGAWALKGEANAFSQGVIYFATPCFIAALFVCLAGDARRFKLRHPLTALALTGLKFALVLFFTDFAVGEYAQRQEYQTYVLSRVAHFGSFAGVESFYMALCTMSVFMIVSLLLCCLCKSFNKGGSLPFTASFAAAAFVLHFIAASNDSVKEIFNDPLLLNILSISASVVVPLICYFRNSFKRSRHA